MLTSGILKDMHLIAELHINSSRVMEYSANIYILSVLLSCSVDPLKFMIPPTYFVKVYLDIDGWARVLVLIKVILHLNTYS